MSEPAGATATGATQPAAARAPRSHRVPRKVREAGLAYLLVLPSIVLFGVFVFYPFLKNFWLGLYRTPPFPGLPKQWAGFDQVSDVLRSHDFANSLKVTVLFALYTVPTGIVLGLLLAVLAHQRLAGVTIYRTIFSSTVATSVAVASVIFFTLLNPQVGLFTYWFGREGQPSVLQDPDWALVAVSVATLWQNLGLSFVLMSAGLQAVPDELLEAARVDGAGLHRIFFRIMVPLAKPALATLVIFNVLWAWNEFLFALLMLQ